jgi:S-adenosylmethionine:tRNA ribosyltransferase-isomerase
MRVDLFDFDLPRELIAQRPARPRDAARLLVVGGDGLADRRMLDLPDLLLPGDLLVLNDTRVIPTRLVGRRGDATVEVTLHWLGALTAGARPSEGSDGRPMVAGFARPARRLRPGDRIVFAPDLEAEVLAKGERGEIFFDFQCSTASLIERLRTVGTMPLPPYIQRARGGDPRDADDYQTLFARRDGAVAAPTAALHFTPRLMAALEARGVRHAFLTLHVGAGTFLPVTVAHTEDHRMHAEWYQVSAATSDLIERTQRTGGRVVAVGTTVLRTLETIAARDGRVRASTGETRLFVTPGHRFRVVDRLLTNFHLPRSTLLMLVAAFAGLARMRSAYAHAVAERYRFYSYGDACLLDREPPS